MEVINICNKYFVSLISILPIDTILYSHIYNTNNILFMYILHLLHITIFL